MGAVASTLLTYGDVSRRDDVVLNAIEILTATESQIMNQLGKTTAIDTIHSFLTDTLDQVIGVLKFFLIDMKAEMPTWANLSQDAKRLSERKHFLATSVMR